MKNTRSMRGNTQQEIAHPPAQIAPAFKSPDTGRDLAQLLAEKRNAVDHHGHEAQARRQDAEEQLRHRNSREQLIAEKEREIEEFRAQREREIEAIRQEITRIDTAARNANGQADQHTQAQRHAQLAVQDLETVLGAYAPAALELAAQSGGTPPNGTPTSGAHPDATGGYPVPVATGSGPQEFPNRDQTTENH
ncbi:hypothetical protein E1287_07130 [Actinomadura sp. KC06]|uniref:hypothetical protein n=1 Tax=Actinomadura sp. KC06 TaxID=2530369 RepID=UPI001053D9A9|nr:hypothetical protein [Actinomadura sp. KC06]TDD37826.1 hypothetical protein E1287_07130 [Actinomadura sp. KC06]